MPPCSSKSILSTKSSMFILVSFALLRFIFYFVEFYRLVIGMNNLEIKRMNQKIVRNSERWEDPFDRIISFHYIDNFKKLFIL
uniref:Uncharacterized 9.9 kDa protein n=1 Tax=Vicia faba TaxID=3906 RepID=YCX1_VICFA|nr:RecName: Full=Uncharacterized 9.9 kDa protein [Vicia faba]CAA25290.1 unnamed protein product [Vicia faba]